MPTVMQRLQDHYDESLEYFKKDQIVGIFLQGSQNYGLEIPGSDVDTKLILVPSFKDIAMNSQPVSTTHVRANDEHIDFKDVRLYMQTFRKQNLNFLEILFTRYFIVHPDFCEQWFRLVSEREHIARMNPFRAVKSMKGIAMEKFHAMEHEYPSKIDILRKYGYDPKQLHHLLRVEDYLNRYIKGESYKNCLSPTDPEYLKAVKMGLYDLADAREKATIAIDHVIQMSDEFCSKVEEKEDPAMRELLDDVQYEIMRLAVSKELG